MSSTPPITPDNDPPSQDESGAPRDSRAQLASPRRRRKRTRRKVALIALILAFLLAADYYVYPRLPITAGRAPNKGENALWIRYTWYFGRKSDAEMKELAANLRRRQIKYAYPHVRYIRKDGSLRFRYPDSARRLVEALHRDAPEVKVIAWVYAGNSRGEGEVDLSKASVRNKMVEEAVWLVRKCGFDGVQWDYEICPDGDPGFLALMRETRAAMPPGKILGAAVPLWLPWPIGRWGWSEEYFGQVADSCDQIAVMAYDSGFWLPRSYVWLVRRQVTKVLPAVAAAYRHCKVLIGTLHTGKAFCRITRMPRTFEWPSRECERVWWKPAASATLRA